MIRLFEATETASEIESCADAAPLANALTDASANIMVFKMNSQRPPSKGWTQAAPWYKTTTVTLCHTRLNKGLKHANFDNQ